MPPLFAFYLPLLPGAPPTGYGWSESEVSALSTTTAFRTGLDRRDQFLGIRRCVVCGASSIEGLEHCHIIMVSEPHTWKDLKARGWIPDQAKDDPGHEPRDGMTMCAWHHRLFESYVFFIRFFADIRKFVFINYSARADLQQFHGKAIALDINDRYAPFPSLFIIHEMRVRGFHPFQLVSPSVPAPDDIHWQDWISSEQVFDNASASFKRNMPPHNERSAETQLLSHPTTTTTAPSGQRTLALNADVINDILAATRAMPSWKACVVEGTSWLARRKKTSKNMTSKNMSLLLVHNMIDVIPVDLARGRRKFNSRHELFREIQVYAISTWTGRLRHPKVLDIAFAEAKILSLELDPSTATHIIKADNTEDTQQKQGFFEIDTLLEQEISNRFRDIFRSYQDIDI